VVVPALASLTAYFCQKRGSVAQVASPSCCITLTAVKLLIRRAAVLLASIAMLTGAFLSPAGASTSSYEAASDLGFLPTLLLFVGGPLAIFLLIWLLVVAGSLSRRPKRESDLSWYHEMPDDQDPEAGPREVAQAPEPTESQAPEPTESAAVSEPSGATRVTPSA
jgi:hypothetical protein